MVSSLKEELAHSRAVFSRIEVAEIVDVQVEVPKNSFHLLHLCITDRAVTAHHEDTFEFPRHKLTAVINQADLVIQLEYVPLLGVVETVVLARELDHAL